MHLRLGLRSRPRLAVLALALLGACAKGPEPALDSVWKLPERPRVQGEASPYVVLTDKRGAPAAGAAATFSADMTHPGMKPLVCPARETEAGRYEGKWRWTMAGDWVVVFEARFPDGRRLERREPVTVKAR